MPLVSLGHSGIEVSRLALGSWRTYERTGDAPLPTGALELATRLTPAERDRLRAIGLPR
jgi:aryl-alcohol dehydrogenase-like predicted oxidoreductase